MPLRWIHPAQGFRQGESGFVTWPGSDKWRRCQLVSSSLRAQKLNAGDVDADPVMMPVPCAPEALLGRPPSDQHPEQPIRNLSRFSAATGGRVQTY